MKERYHISGMTCSACSSHVEKAVSKLAGVRKASVNLLTETLEADYDENVLGFAEIREAVEKAGYGAAPLKESGRPAGVREDSHSPGALSGQKNPRQEPDEEKAVKKRLAVSVCFLIPLMYVAMHPMLYRMFGIPVPSFVSRYLSGNENAVNFALTQLLLVLPILYLNRKFFIVGFRSLRHLSPNMDSLIAVGASAAVGYGVFALYRIGFALGRGNMEVVEHYSQDLYFESAGMILTLITVGKYLESRAKGKTGQAITMLMDLSPKTAVVLAADGTEKEVPTRDLRAGDIFLVKPGCLIPADGTVLEGGSSVNEAAITGESVPVEKREGDAVISATVNRNGFLKCRADRVGDDTTLSQIIRLVEEAGASKAPIARLADRVAGVFVPVVMGISLITFLAWLAAGAGGEFSISCAIAVLVISCPCALGLATPVAIMVGTGVGAEHGILIRSGEALQRARDIDTVVLDKTGTITSGQLKVMGTSMWEKGLTEAQMVQVAAALEKKSEHPLAEAVLSYAEMLKLSVPQIRDFHAEPGRGVEGVLEDGGLWDGGVKAGGKCLAGNLAYMEENGIAVGDEVRKCAENCADEGMTPLFVAADGRFIGMLHVADEIRKSSFQAVRRFAQMGIRVVMLTGDNARTAEAVRKRLGIPEAVAQVLPQEKEKAIRRFQSQGHKTAMIGDGINDAPALAAADVGMAIGAGTDVAMESADIVLMKSDLRDAATAVSLSRNVIRNIKQNLFWAFFYNCVGIPLAAGCWYPVFHIRLSPMFGAAAMSLSSLFVVCNALRLKGFRTGFERKKKEEGGGERPAERKKTMTKVMKIEGMMCEHCAGRVTKALEAVAGVSSVTVNLAEKTAAVETGPETTDEALTAAVEEAGYQTVEIR